MIHLLDLGRRRDDFTRGPHPREVVNGVGAWREMIAKKERTIVAKLAIIAEPVAACAGRAARVLRFELRINRFENRRERVVDRDEMRRLAHLQLEGDQNPVANDQRIDRPNDPSSRNF